MVSVITDEDSTGVSVADETNGIAISVHGGLYQRRCRKVENVSSGEPLMAFAESIKSFDELLDPGSTFLCRDDFFLGRIRLDFEYCQMIKSPASATATKIAANNAKRTRCRRVRMRTYREVSVIRTHSFFHPVLSAAHQAAKATPPILSRAFIRAVIDFLSLALSASICSGSLGGM